MPISTNGHHAPLRPAPPSDPCWLEVDLGAVVANVRALKALVGSRTEILAVVKANAYGLGAIPVARAALEGGATGLGVARVREGVELRRAGIAAPILNLAYTAPEETRLAIEHRITLTIADIPSARALAAVVPSEQTVGCHLKVDTGLSRFGAQWDELEPLLHELRGQARLRIDGLFSHLATADESDASFARQQLARFGQAQRRVRAAGFSPGIHHLGNSAATLTLPEARLDAVRLGITLSGHYPAAHLPRMVNLCPAVAFKARLARVYDLVAGASVGYGRTYRVSSPLRAGLVPVGYADGLPRHHSNRGAVLIRGRRAPIIGRVSMDQCVVDLSALLDAQPGDEVVLFGRQCEAEIALHEFASWSDSIAHEALCRIGPRVPRHYSWVDGFPQPSFVVNSAADGLLSARSSAPA